MLGESVVDRIGSQSSYKFKRRCFFEFVIKPGVQLYVLRFAIQHQFPGPERTIIGSFASA